MRSGRTTFRSKSGQRARPLLSTMSSCHRKIEISCQTQCSVSRWAWASAIGAAGFGESMLESSIAAAIWSLSINVAQERVHPYSAHE